MPRLQSEAMRDGARSRVRRALLASVLTAGMMGFAGVSAADAAELVGLITKTNNNPFFVKMKEGAEAKAKELGAPAAELCRQV